MRKKVLSTELILDTAAKIIIEKDIKQCNMRNISNELGVAVGTLYNYYKSRNQLLKDLFGKSWTLTLNRLLNIKELEMTYEEKMISLIEKIYEDTNNRGGLGHELMKINRNGIEELKNEVFEKFPENMISIFYEVNVDNYNKLGVHYKEKDLIFLTRSFFSIVYYSIIRDEKLTPKQIKLLINNLFKN